MAATQPITFADRTAPPTLLLHDEDDETVMPANSERLATALAAAGNRAALELYPGLGHIGLVAALAAPLRWLAPVLDDVTAFLRRGGGVNKSSDRGLWAWHPIETGGGSVTLLLREGETAEGFAAPLSGFHALSPVRGSEAEGRGSAAFDRLAVRVTLQDG